HHLAGDARRLDHDAPLGRVHDRALGRARAHRGPALGSVMAERALGIDWALAWSRGCAEVVTQHREELIDLDRAIGDGDHGEILNRGFTAVLAKLDGFEPATVGDVLKLVATTLMSSVGGAAGPLYGTAFLRGAKAADAEQIDA